ncbi:hypothetical protein OAF54_00785 [bacterium]|nr:hypothetical protein [bacterium]
MTDSRLPVGGSGEYLNTRKVTTDAGEVHNEVVETNNYYSPIGVNSTQTPLAAGATFQGTSEDVGDYSRVGVAFYTPFGEPTDITVYMEVSHDEVNWSSIPRSVANTSIANPIMWAVVERYFRIKIVNGASTASVFSCQVQYSNNDDILLGHPLNETLLDEKGAILTRAVLVGKTSGGTYINVPVDGDGHLHTDIPVTAFGDVRTAELSPVFQASFEYTVTNTEIGTIETANGATVTQADAMVVCTTGTTTGADAEWETAHNIKYRAGLGGLMRCTAMFTTGVAGTEQMIGIADTEGVSASHKNGYGVGYDGDTFGYMRWQNDVLTTIAQADWDDPMDGTGPSGMTLDPTKLNVYFIQFQYLGAGAQTLWIENDTTGIMVKAHTVQYTNMNTVPSVYMPNFHMMLHVMNNATTANLVAKSSSMGFFVEGKSKYLELQQPSFTSERRTKTSVTTETAIFTVRNKTTYASKTNFIDIVLQGLSTSLEASQANNLAGVRVVKNATLGGTPSWTDIDTTDSLCEIDVAGTTVTGGRTLLDFDLAGKNDSTGANLLPYEIIISPGETITVAGLSAGSATINASLLWKELF